jgi:hypothetical protein
MNNFVSTRPAGKVYQVVSIGADIAAVRYA